MDFNKIRQRIIFVLIVCTICFWTKGQTPAKDIKHLEGVGSKTDPYLISDAEDLLTFAKMVNEGNTFEKQYFLQTDDIDLEFMEWPVIAPYESEYCFDGVYNGGGHCIKNLSVHTNGNNALFGKLGGTVMNLGIESGEIQGACVGGITSHSSKTTALIINCYSKAMVKGARAGGIADNFNGTIANCWTDCELTADSAEYVGGIVSYAALGMLNCYSIETDDRNSDRFYGNTVIDKNAFRWDDLAEQLNRSLYFSAVATEISSNDLNMWVVGKDGRLRFAQDTMRFSVKYMSEYFCAHLLVHLPWILIVICIAGSWILIFGKNIKVVGSRSRSLERKKNL